MPSSQRPQASPIPARTLRQELRAALLADRLMLNWQPIVSVTTGKWLGFEALLRWHHPKFGTISPGIFIPMAEATGLSRRVDMWVLQRACNEARQWPTPLRLSINVASSSFLHPDFIQVVRRITELAGIDPARLELEVTERVIIDNVDLFTHHESELRAMGVRVLLDDFGTGYSSLDVLADLSLQKIKLDRSFLRGLGTSNRTDRVVRLVLELARELDLITCAEGVERPEQLSFLRNHGCHEFQGFLAARPRVLEEADFTQSSAHLLANAHTNSR
jgi:EAL domain-containing protein (putative c-di-GMP-specific phosphodiesterase class I)